MQFSSIFGSTVANDLNDDDVVRGLLGARFVHPYHGKANVAEPVNGGTGMAKSPSPTVGVTSPDVRPSPGTILPSGDAAAPSAVAPATITSVTLPGHMTVNLELDANAQAAPTYYATDFQIAANMISNAIADPITVNLSVDVSGTGGGASAGPANGAFEPYSTVRSILASRANTPQEQAAVASLPNTSSIQGQSQVVVWNAQEKAFGELSATDPGIDGNAQFASDIGDGQLVGVALHELTHAMGRVPAGDSSQPEPDIFDLFRFTSPGTRYFSDAIPASASYFSLDGGNTDIADYGENSDPSDFLNPPNSNRTPNDPFNEYYDGNTQQSFTPIDLEQLEALGFNVVCFASGTLICTARGDIPVQDLVVGDRVVTAAGEQRPIRWLGHRTIDCRRHPNPREAMPVRVAAHAFGENRPARDLYLSPGHSVCIEVVGGVLIPIGRLVNGATIEQLDVETVTYWHVELDSHDIIIAENLACESYIDCGTRAFFAESGVVALGASPDAPRLTTDDYCRPFHPEGVLVDMVRDRLCLRASDLGWRLAVDDALAGLWLEVDGTRVEVLRHGLIARATLPADAGEVRLRSDFAVPATIHGDRDERRLGLRLAALVIDDGLGCRREIACTDERLTDGFHPHEGTHRWTDGDACLPAALWAGCWDRFHLRLAFAGPALPRWVAPAATAALGDAIATAA